MLPAFFAGWPLLPTHIVFFELIIAPWCSLVFEAFGSICSSSASAG
jgi:hypothetical protein